MNKNNGIIIATDTHNNQIALYPQEAQGNTAQLSAIIHHLSPILVQSYAVTELNFAQKMPELVASDFMLKSVAPFLQHPANNTDWKVFKQKTVEHLEHFFVTTDWATYSKPEERHIFVEARELKTDKTLGIIQFIQSPDFEQNTIKAALFGVIPSALNRGLEKILMSSLFIINPSVKRIFLHTRSTNVSDIEQYQEWGFANTSQKMPHWIDLEYNVETATTLQELAHTFSV